MNLVKVLVLLGAIAAALLGAALFVIAQYPFAIAESGPSGFDIVSPAEYFGQVLVSVILLLLAWWGFRFALSEGVRRKLIIAGAMLVALTVAWNYVKPPAGAHPIGGKFYVEKREWGAEMDPVYYNLWRREFIQYERVDIEMSAYTFHKPDCVLYTGLNMFRSPRWAVCGDRSPMRVLDTTMVASSIVELAMRQPPYSEDFRRLEFIKAHNAGGR